MNAEQAQAVRRLYMDHTEAEVAAMLNLPPGCVFHPRCPIAVDRCRVEVPDLREIRPGHRAACLLA